MLSGTEQPRDHAAWRHSGELGLRASGYPVLEADEAQLSAYQRRHVTIYSHYTVALPDLGDTHRVLQRPPKTTGPGDEDA